MRKNKAKTMLATALIVVVLAIIAIYNVAFEVGTLERSKYIEVPTFGYLSCSPQASKTINANMSGDYGQDSMSNVATATAYTCKDFLGMNDGCSITMTVIDGDLTTFADTTAQLDYQLVPSGTSFRADRATTLPGGLSGYDDMERATVQMSSADVLWVRYTEGKGTVGQDKYNGKVRFSVTGSPFTLYNHNSFSDTNGQVMEGARPGNCFLESSIYKDRMITYADPGIKDLQGRELDWRALNKPYGVYTYMAGFTPVPSFDAKIETYNGKEAYCMGNKLYETLEITVNGYTYKIVNYDAGGFIQTVTCCNGDEAPDKLCVDHMWVAKDQAECNQSAGKFCPQSTYQPYGSAQYKRYACESGKCVSDVINVECNSDADCENGEACVRYSDPKKNDCVSQGKGGLPVCGDNKCETYESETCPLDCGGTSPGSYMFWVILICSALVIIIIMLIVKLSMKRQ